MKRDASKEKFWRKTIAEARGSGKGIREFCRQKGLKEALFYSWHRELRMRESEAADRSGFVELVRPVQQGAAGVRIRIGERIEIVLERFFIHYLPKGVYVFEYSARAQLKGNYQSGIATVQHA